MGALSCGNLWAYPNFERLYLNKQEAVLHGMR